MKLPFRAGCHERVRLETLREEIVLLIVVYLRTEIEVHAIVTCQIDKISHVARLYGVENILLYHAELRSLGCETLAIIKRPRLVCDFLDIEHLLQFIPSFNRLLLLQKEFGDRFVAEGIDL